ncbi:MAG: hypothetical protein WC797_02180 [Candidatus Paceibacterota bacterium]|jgi:hypothetical protein
MKVLDKLFGSQDRVKIMRLFILNREQVFENADISKRAKVSTRSLSKELALLGSIGLIKKKSVFVEKESKGGKKKTKINGWQTNVGFVFLAPLEKLLFNAELYKDSDLIERLKKAGKLKLVVTAGIFMNDDNSRADLLVVGDYLKRNILDSSIKVIESEMGRELNYGVFDTNDFVYRLSVCDKFVRDVLDFPHKKILNKFENLA